MPKLTGNRCQCPTCGEYFNGAAGFDAHRIGEYAKAAQPHDPRRCLTLAEMIARGWIRNAKGFWVTDSHAQRFARQSAAGFAAPRTHAAMVQPTPASDAPESRARASQSASAVP